jgi:rhomboid protease GluP
MIALFFIGLLLEPYLGRIRFAIAYFLTGIAASMTSLWWHDFVISAGASGAIFGMYGVFLAMLTTNLIEKSARKGLLVSIAIFVGYNLAYGMHGHIDNAAHIGGLICGFMIGYGYYPSLKRPDAFSFKYLTIGILTLIIISTSFITYINIPNDFGKYQKKIRSFAIIESMALEVLRLPQNTPKEKILYGIKDRGIYYWNQDIKLINDLEKLNLPEVIHERDRRLIRYCNLRIKSYRLLYKTIAENTDKYRDSIKFYDMEIKGIIKGLKHK